MIQAAATGTEAAGTTMLPSLRSIVMASWAPKLTICKKTVFRIIVVAHSGITLTKAFISSTCGKNILLGYQKGQGHSDKDAKQGASTKDLNAFSAGQIFVVFFASNKLQAAVSSVATFHKNCDSFHI